MDEVTSKAIFAQRHRTATLAGQQLFHTVQNPSGFQKFSATLR
jgi:hypothetical protein